MSDAERFLCSDPQAGDMSFADVESILDALEAALVAPDTPLFDSARQAWQPVGLHPEVRQAWAHRERYRRPGDSRLVLPTLPQPREVDDEEMLLRQAAYSRVRGRGAPDREEKQSQRKRRGIALGGLIAMAILAAVGWAIVRLALRLSDFAASAMTSSKVK